MEGADWVQDVYARCNNCDPAQVYGFGLHYPNCDSTELLYIKAARASGLKILRESRFRLAFRVWCFLPDC